MSRYTDRIPDPICRKKGHTRFVGVVSNLGPAEPFDMTRAHASTSVCARHECQEDAREWVRAHTHEDGIFATFEENRAASSGLKTAEDAQMQLPVGGA